MCVRACVGGWAGGCACMWACMCAFMYAYVSVCVYVWNNVLHTQITGATIVRATCSSSSHTGHAPRLIVTKVDASAS